MGFKGGLLNHARTIVAALFDFEALQSWPLAAPNGLEIEVDHKLARRPAIESGHDANTHGRAGITV